MFESGSEFAALSSTELHMLPSLAAVLRPRLKFRDVQ